MIQNVEMASLNSSVTAVARGQIYSFLELTFGHPAQEGIEYFRREFTEAMLHETLKKLQDPSAFDQEMHVCFERFFANLRKHSVKEIEGDYINLFSSNYPMVPCPPYGSLFTKDENKRLEEMTAIKEAYRESGMALSEKHDELPDHLGVELEFLQYLSFREGESIQDREDEIVKFWRAKQAHFLDRFTVPFVTSLAGLAKNVEPDNMYTDLLCAIRYFIDHHIREYAAATHETN